MVPPHSKVCELKTLLHSRFVTIKTSLAPLLLFLLLLLRNFMLRGCFGPCNERAASSGKWRNAFSGEEESISVRGLEEPNLLETQAPAAPPTAVPEPQAMQMGTSGQDLVMRPRSAHRARRSSASHGPKKRNSLTGSATSEEEPQQDDRGSGFASRLGGGQAGERVEYNPLQAGGKEVRELGTGGALVGGCYRRRT